jgi:hypothetical protein
MPATAQTPAEWKASITSEDELLRQVVQLAGLRGWHCYHVRRSDVALTTGAGFPDLVMVGHGRVIYAELKAERGRLSPDQERWRDSLLEAGADWRLWRPSSWPEIERTICTRPS